MYNSILNFSIFSRMEAYVAALEAKLAEASGIQGAGGRSIRTCRLTFRLDRILDWTFDSIKDLNLSYKSSIYVLLEFGRV